MDGYVEREPRHRVEPAAHAVARPWSRLARMCRGRLSSRRPAGATAVGLVLALAFSSFAAVSATGATVQPSPTCATLAQGSAGPAVATIQTAVKATSDGDFGPLTAAAVSKWQKKHHVKTTGVVDAATWAALPADVRQTACGQQVHGTGVGVTCAHLATGSTGPAVEVLQKAVGTDVDGAFGPHTAAAVSAKQTKAKLTASGVVDAPTWAALGLTGTPACMAAPSTTGSGGSHHKHKLTANEKAQRAIRAQVVKLAAELLDEPGTTSNPIAAQARQFAHAQKGKPYVWGGTGPKGYDCSGLVMAAYLHAGITLPRVAADQYGAGPTVPLDRARQGDLLFYASDVTRPSTIYHVVMYDGGGRIFDAPHTGAFVGSRPLWTNDLLPVAVRPVASVKLPVRRGSSGWTVAQLQQELDRHGAKVSVDGGYGPATQAAVKAWKATHGLPATTRVGRTAWLALAWPAAHKAPKSHA